MLLGRNAECIQLERLMEEARSGHGSALVIRGSPGIGKSSLLAYASDAAGSMRVLTASGVETESELPFAGLAALLRPLYSYLEGLSAPQRSALEGALALGPAPSADRFAIDAATLSLISVAAEDRPVLALVDDAHWLDAPSVGALLFAARRLSGDAVAMLFAARDGDGASFPAQGLPDLVLGGLGREDCETLLRSLLGRAASPAVLERLATATGGNPLALVELPLLMSDGRLAAATPLETPLPVGPGISRAFSRRIEALPRETQRALALAAVGDSGTIAELAEVLSRFALTPAALGPAESAGLVTIEGAELRFSHPLLRAVAYQELPPPDRRVAHLALAEVLAADPSPTRRAWHLAAAVVEPDEVAARELDSAARVAHERAAPAAAAAALETAARITPSRDDRVRRLMLAARRVPSRRAA